MREVPPPLMLSSLYLISVTIGLCFICLESSMFSTATVHSFTVASHSACLQCQVGWGLVEVGFWCSAHSSHPLPLRRHTYQWRFERLRSPNWFPRGPNWPTQCSTVPGFLFFGVLWSLTVPILPASVITPQLLCHKSPQVQNCVRCNIDSSTQNRG